ncbi:hypothetical protein AB5J72_44055 [Streptomyces sp. CG1]|uniref:hypothetical protein n=1 Tax=Streptomyces sp. CG1 TaxID=1287523 RepID=UPI0034E2840C
MRNQRALAAACATVAALGFAAPASVADDMGNGGGSSNGNTCGDPCSGHFSGDFSDDSNRSFGDGGRGDGSRDLGGGDDFGRGDDNGNGGRGDGSGDRGDEFGARGDDFGGHGDGGGRRNIEAAPGVIVSGARLTVTVDDCRDGTVSSHAFQTAQLHPFRDDTSRARARIDHDARPGRYDITAHCDGRSLTRPSAFTVLGGVEAGTGGGIRSGATRADTAIGVGLVTSAVVGGGVYWLRRRNEK